MIIENQQKQVEVELDGEASQSIDMVIDESSIGILMNFLSKNIYSDPIGSPIREWVSNAWDANVKAGVNNPILVNLTKLSYSKWEFSVEDTALGLDDQDVENVIKKYLCSTKRQDNTQLGALGVGFKSGLAYTNSFTFRCRKNGKERTYIMYEGEFGNKIDLLHEQDTSEPNGVKMILEVKPHDAGYFSKKIREQLSYFSNTFITDDYSRFNNDYKIYENELFKWSEVITDRKLHLCLGEVYYPMDFSKLGILDVHIPVAIKLELSDKINPTISRESLMFTPESKALILEKITKVADWFVDKYNEEIAEFKTFPEAFDHINKYSHDVMINEKNFCIDSIIPLSTKSVSQPKIEGISLMSPKFYKDNFAKILQHYNVVAYENHKGIWQKKHIVYELTNMSIDLPKNVVLIDFNLNGNLKQFLREKYGKRIVYIERNPPKNLYWYIQHLFLRSVGKEKWRDLIKEFQFVNNQICSRWNDETGLENKQEYIDWLADKKLKAKENREKGIITGNYIPLNKQKGQITLNIARDSSRADSGVVFDKTVVDIANLHKLGKLHILVDKAQAYLQHYVSMFPNVRFIFISPREIKYIDKLKNFKNMEEFTKSKPFARFATAALINDVLDVVPDNEEIIYKAFPKYEKLKEKLEEYKEEHYIRASRDIVNMVLEVSKEANLWDHTIYSDVKEFREIMGKFGFLSLVNLERNYNEEHLRIAKNLVYIMLKWQKINHQMVTDMELTLKVPDEVYEDQAVQYTVEVEEGLVNVV